MATRKKTKPKRRQSRKKKLASSTLAFRSRKKKIARKKLETKRVIEIPASPPLLKVPPILRKRGKRKPKPKPVTVSLRIANQYFVYIKKVLESLTDCAERTAYTDGSMVDSTVHQNKDGSIDGQLTISGIARGTSPQNIVNVISDCLPRTLSKSIWVSLGFRWPMENDDDDERYDHYKGLNQTFGYPVRGDVAKSEHIPNVKNMIRKVMRAGWRKPTDIIFRLNWNQYNRQPQKLKKRKGHHNGGRY